MTTAAIIAFILASIAIELTPGPNMGYLAIVSASSGWRSGIAAVFGTTLGLLLIGIATALGLSIVVTGSPTVYEVLRWGGVLYLFYLAWEAWQSKSEISPHTVDVRKENTKHFTRGLIVNLLNPKAVLFYAILLPSFIASTPKTFTAILTLTVLYVVIATVVHTSIVLLASTAQKFLENPKRMKIARKIFAVLLATIAVWFAWSTSR